MRKGRQCSDFAYVELEDLSEVARLREDEEVECPGSAKVGDDDGVDGRGCEEGAPRCRPEIGDGALDVRQRLLDVEPLAGRDGRMETRLLEREPHPENVPDHSEDAVKVERRLPADSVRQPTGEWHADHGAGIRAAKGQSGQSGSLQRRCPPPPDAVAGRVRDSLFELNFFFLLFRPMFTNWLSVFIRTIPRPVPGRCGRGWRRPGGFWPRRAGACWDKPTRQWPTRIPFMTKATMSDSLVISQLLDWLYPPAEGPKPPSAVQFDSQLSRPVSNEDEPLLLLHGLSKIAQTRGLVYERKFRRTC